MTTLMNRFAFLRADTMFFVSLFLLSIAEDWNNGTAESQSFGWLLFSLILAIVFVAADHFNFRNGKNHYQYSKIAGLVVFVVTTFETVFMFNHFSTYGFSMLVFVLAIGMIVSSGIVVIKSSTNM